MFNCYFASFEDRTIGEGVGRLQGGKRWETTRRSDTFDAFMVLRSICRFLDESALFLRSSALMKDPGYGINNSW